jgi:putative sterol carrier protein
MSDLRRPPRNLTPTEFFESWLPAQAQGVATPARPLTVRVTLSGDDGGAWDLELGAAGLRVHPGASGGTPDVSLWQSTQDWRAIVHGEEGALDLAPAQARPTDLLFLDAAAQQVVLSARGTIRFEVTGYNGRTWSLTVKLGPQPQPEQPDATISVDAETYAQIQARTLPPPAAFFSGKIKITGDMQLAMQLGMSLMPRMG